MTREEAIAELKRDIELVNDFTEEYINAVNKAIKVLEQEPFINKPCISKGACHEDKNKVLDKIKAEIENQDKWLMCAGYNAYNVDIAFNSIKRVLKEARDEE